MELPDVKFEEASQAMHGLPVQTFCDGDKKDTALYNKILRESATLCTYYKRFQ